MTEDKPSLKGLLYNQRLISIYITLMLYLTVLVFQL